MTQAVASRSGGVGTTGSCGWVRRRAVVCGGGLTAAITVSVGGLLLVTDELPSCPRRSPMLSFESGRHRPT